MGKIIDTDNILFDIYTVKEGSEFPYEKAYKKILKNIENAPEVNIISLDKLAKFMIKQGFTDAPCNFCEVEEWLPYRCEKLNKDCFSDVKDCWKEFFKYCMEVEE